MVVLLHAALRIGAGAERGTGTARTAGAVLAARGAAVNHVWTQ